MRAVFRVDASTQMGIGHLMRCLTVAEALRKRGAHVSFICREHSGSLIALLGAKAIPLTLLPAASASQRGTADKDDYSAWLGATQEEDADQTIQALNAERPDWLIVDHYGLDIDWEKRLRPHVNKLMVVDDLANRVHDCDLCLDQNFSVEGERRYLGLLNDDCKLLIGPRFALLRPEYAAYRKTQLAREGRVKRVLVFFGGSDDQNMTGLALDALSRSDLMQLEVDVVVGINNAHLRTIEKQVALRSLTTLHGLRPHLADLMVQADLAIGAGGATTWERMCLGLPSVVVSIAENQRPASEALAKAKLINYIGHFDGVTTDRLSQSLLTIVHDIELLGEMAARTYRHVDGIGVQRLIEVMVPSDSDKVRLRPACEDDVVTYCSWANDLKAQEDCSLISLEECQSWLVDKVHIGNIRQFVVEADDLPVGLLQFHRELDEVRVNFCLDKIVCGRGWVQMLIHMGIKFMREIEPVRLSPKSNMVSNAAFLRLALTRTLPSVRLFSVSILSDRESWMNEYIQELFWDWLVKGYRVQWVHNKEELLAADFCFYLSCGQIVPVHILSQYKHNLVVHESDLPQGRGWSPLTWQILEARSRIPATLLEAAEKVDSGAIYAQEWMTFEGHELVHEMREKQALATTKLCKKFVEKYSEILETAREQVGKASFYTRRREADSEIDPTQSIESQFNLLRVVDNQRYPAYFDRQNYRYLLKIEKVRKL